jgi:hypothetical protein
MVVVPDPTNEISFVVGLGFLMPSRTHLRSSAPRGRIFNPKRRDRAALCRQAAARHRLSSRSADWHDRCQPLLQVPNGGYHRPVTAAFGSAMCKPAQARNRDPRRHHRRPDARPGRRGSLPLRRDSYRGARCFWARRRRQAGAIIGSHTGTIFTPAAASWLDPRSAASHLRRHWQFVRCRNHLSCLTPGAPAACG